ncbi:LpqN/LpqT family lipoprotein [Paraoerskovia sediminicola]|nr:LpqN/LpqT family lipoprotein [Paraoerskovia sediminicola]
MSERGTRRRGVALTALAGVTLALTACGAPSSDAQADAATGDGTRTFQVPGSELPLTVTAPAGWDATTQDGVYFLRSDERYGDAGVRPSVVVTADDAPQGSVDDAAAAIEDYASGALTGWVTQDAGPTTFAGLDAAEVIGSHETEGVPLTQESTVVDTSSDGAAHQAVVTVTYGQGDTAGAESARAVAETLTVG